MNRLSQGQGSERSSEQSGLKNFLRGSLRSAGESVLRATNSVRTSTRRLLVVGSFIAPAVLSGASQYGCTLDTYGTGKFSEQDSGGAGGEGGGQDAMVLGDSANFPDGTVHDDADADVAMTDAEIDGDVPVDSPVDAPVEADAMSDADADVAVDAPVDAPMEADAMFDADADVGVDAPVYAAVDAPVEADAMTDADADVAVDAPVDSPVDAPVEADAMPDADAGPVCGDTGTVVFDSAMLCYKEGIFRSGNFLPAPDSSPDTAACQTGLCANSPVSGDVEVLWVQETNNDGLFTSVSTPVSYAARCTTYTSATPPSLTQMKTELESPTGWFVPGVSKVGTSYTLKAVSCAPGQSALYEVIY